MFRKLAVPVIAVVTAAGAIGFALAGQDKNDKPAAKLIASGVARHQSSPFKGAKANTGYAIHYTENGTSKLTVSDDFVIPDTPAPSWQLVDSAGNAYLLNQFRIKGGTNRTITVPSYVRDIAKVQVWCSYAEVLLGEASFEEPVKSSM
jgi:hypothetical protein